MTRWPRQAPQPEEKRKNYEDWIPANFDDCAVSPKAAELRQALEVDSPAISILISGPPGTGKTLMAKLAFQEHGIHMIDFNAMDIFSNVWKRQLKQAITTPASLRGRVGVFIHSVVGSFEQGVRHDELITFLVALLKQHQDHGCVLVVEADELATRPIKQLAGLVKHNIRFFKPSVKDMFTHAKR